MFGQQCQRKIKLSFNSLYRKWNYKTVDNWRCKQRICGQKSVEVLKSYMNQLII